MSNTQSPRPQAETPWEFYPDDDLREEPGEATEDQAMHVEFVNGQPTMPKATPMVVHYLDDEEPEVPDLSLRAPTNDITPEVDALLIQQHYISE